MGGLLGSSLCWWPPAIALFSVSSTLAVLLTSTPNLSIPIRFLSFSFLSHELSRLSTFFSTCRPSYERKLHRDQRKSNTASNNTGNTSKGCLQASQDPHYRRF